MESISEKELQRQYDILKQNMSMHAILQEEYSRKAKTTEIVLLICSLVFGATAFAGNDFFMFFGVSAEAGRIVLGLVSIAALACSLAILILNWKGQAALHGEATDRFHEALQEFRKYRKANNLWPEEKKEKLATAYREVNKNSVGIPSKRFSKLKAKYHMRKEINRWIDQYPGCPRIVLSLLMGGHDTVKVLRDFFSKTARKAGSQKD